MKSSPSFLWRCIHPTFSCLLLSRCYISTSLLYCNKKKYKIHVHVHRYGMDIFFYLLFSHTPSVISIVNPKRSKRVNSLKSSRINNIRQQQKHQQQLKQQQQQPQQHRAVLLHTTFYSMVCITTEIALLIFISSSSVFAVKFNF